MSDPFGRLRVPHPWASLSGRLMVVSLGLFVLMCVIGWLVLTAATRAAAERAVDAELESLLLDLRGYWATAEITGTVPPGPSDLKWHWQIQAADGRFYRSDWLAREDIRLQAAGEGPQQTPRLRGTESALGPMRQAEMTVLERRPRAPETGTGAREQLLVTYIAAISVEDRAALITSQEAPLRRAVRWVGFVFAGLTVLFLVTLGGLVRWPIGRLHRAALRFRAAETARLEGRYPTELAPVVTSLNDAIAQKERLVERTRRYVEKIAHDLKHPLAIARNALASDQDRALALARLDGMTGMLDRYAQLARAIGPGGPHPPLALTAVLEDAQVGFALLYRPRPVTITVEADPTLKARLARQDLEAIITNLVANAHRHADTCIALGARAEGSDLVLEVADDGPGIAPSHRQRALIWGARGVDSEQGAEQAGRRADLSAPGSGFGLAIVADLVALYEGAVVLDQAPLGGLLVRVTLPGVVAPVQRGPKRRRTNGGPSGPVV